MTILATLDSDNRVTGFRIGPYSPSDVLPNEIDITALGKTYDEVRYCLYDQSKKTFTVDSICQEMRDRDIIPYNAPTGNYDYTEDDAAAAIQNALDAKAQEYLYDNIFTATTYTNSTNPRFKADADAFIKWRDEVWVWAYAKLDDVKNNTAEKPEFSKLLEDMPLFSAPIYPE